MRVRGGGSERLQAHFRRFRRDARTGALHKSDAPILNASRAFFLMDRRADAVSGRER